MQALGEWRRQWLARAAMRRLYCRRALLGWHERTQQLRYARARLWGAARLLLYGSMARCFAAWLQLTQVGSGGGAGGGPAAARDQGRPGGQETA